MSNTPYDVFLDQELERFNEDDEDEVVDDDWLIDRCIEHQIEMENYYD